MWQALCYTGRAFDTCWRPGKVANYAVYDEQGAPWVPIRLHR